MGIAGLLPFLKPASRQVNMREYKGCTVAVDSYCWLHKGAFSCAGKLALGEKTDSYVYYCMKFVNMLLANDIKPVMVFDGCNLPSKERVEKDRRERRQQYRKKAAQFLREGKKKEATECFQRCVDITSEMALALMKACRAKGVDCIVAPYEADAQLAYLNKIGIADIVITEDSDLILFGCERVVYKLDHMGNGVMIEQDRLSLAAKVRNYTFDRFRYMCILSGCDYLASLPGIGLGKACKLLKVSSNPDFTKTLRKIPTLLKVNARVTDEYVDGFVKADNTFLYQLVFDPLRKKVLPLNPYPDGLSRDDLPYAGTYHPQDVAYQMALGNLDVRTKKVLDSFNPDTFKPPPQKGTSWNATANKPLPPHRHSIWTRSFKPKQYKINIDPTEVERSSTKGQEVTVKMKGLKSPQKRARETVVCLDSKTDSELATMYEGAPPSKRLRLDEEADDDIWNDNVADPFSDFLDAIDQENTAPDEAMEADDEDEPLENLMASLEEKKSPEKPKKSRNIFAISKDTKKEKFSLNKPKENVEVRSRFFSEKPLTNKKPKTTFLDCMDCHEVISAEEDRKKSDKNRLDNTLQKFVSPKHEKERDGSNLTSLSPSISDDVNLEKETESVIDDIGTEVEEVKEKNKKTVVSAFSWDDFKSRYSKGANSCQQKTGSKANVNKEFKPVTPKVTTFLSSFQGRCDKVPTEKDEVVNAEISDGLSGATQGSPGQQTRVCEKTVNKKFKTVTPKISTLLTSLQGQSDEVISEKDDAIQNAEIIPDGISGATQGSPGQQTTGNKTAVNKKFKAVTPKITTLLTSRQGQCDKLTGEEENSDDNVEIEPDSFNASSQKTQDCSPIEKRGQGSKTDLRTMFQKATKSVENSVDNDSDCCEVDCEELDYKDYLQQSGTQVSETSTADNEPSQRSVGMYSIDGDSISFSQSPLVEEKSTVASKAEVILAQDEDSNDVKIISVEKTTTKKSSNLLTKLSTPAVPQGKSKMTGCRSSGLSKSKGRSKTVKRNIENDPSQKNITKFFSQFKHEKNVEKLPCEKIPLSPSKINIPSSMTPEMKKSCDLAQVQRRLVV